MRLASSQRASILRNPRNLLKDSERPRHHNCLGKRYSRAACRGSTLVLKRCHKACSLRPDPKAEFIAASIELVEAKAEAIKVFNAGRAVEEALAPKGLGLGLDQGHPLRKRSLKMIEKARQAAQKQVSEVKHGEEVSRLIGAEAKQDPTEVLLTRA